MRKERTSFR